MKKFRVRAILEHDLYCEVEADNEEEAREKAEELTMLGYASEDSGLTNEQIGWFEEGNTSGDFRITEVEEVAGND